MAFLVVEALPAGIKLPAADDIMRTFTSGKCGFGASAPLLTEASPMHFSGANIRGSAILPKLVKLVGPLSTLVEELFLCFARSACECSCLVQRLPPWRDVAAELDTAGLLNADLSLSSSQ